MILSFENYAKKKKIAVNKKVENVSHDINYDNLSDEEIGNIFEELYYTFSSSAERINEYKNQIKSKKLMDIM